jgi:hypothetical protein
VDVLPYTVTEIAAGPPLAEEAIRGGRAIQLSPEAEKILGERAET